MRICILMACLVFGVCAGVFMPVSAAKADILITPTMVVLEGRDRFSYVTLANTSNKTKVYEMGFERLEMHGDKGGYIEVEKPESGFDLVEHLVFAPRRVSLAPGASQKIRLALRRPESIPDGDYHVHLKFTALPDEVPDLGIVSTGRGAAMGVAVSVSYSIPVMLRVGSVEVSAEIGDIIMTRSPDDGSIGVVVPVTRSEGAYSILGYLYMFHIDENGKEELVAEVSNANIFSEVRKSEFLMRVNKDVVGGSFRIVLRHYNPSREIVYGERTFALQ